MSIGVAADTGFAGDICGAAVGAGAAVAVAGEEVNAGAGAAGEAGGARAAAHPAVDGVVAHAGAVAAAAPLPILGVAHVRVGGAHLPSTSRRHTPKRRIKAIGLRQTTAAFFLLQLQLQL